MPKQIEKQIEKYIGINAVLEEMARDLPQEKNKKNRSTHRDLQIAANWNRGQI